MTVVVFIITSKTDSLGLLPFDLEYLQSWAKNQKMCEADIRGRPRTDRSNLAHAGMFSKSVSPEALVSGPLKHQNTKSSSRHMLLTPLAFIYFQINMQTSANGNGLSMLKNYTFV